MAIRGTQMKQGNFQDFSSSKWRQKWLIRMNATESGASTSGWISLRQRAWLQVLLLRTPCLRWAAMLQRIPTPFRSWQTSYYYYILCCNAEPYGKSSSYTVLTVTVKYCHGGHCQRFCEGYLFLMVTFKVQSLLHLEELSYPLANGNNSFNLHAKCSQGVE